MFINSLKFVHVYITHGLDDTLFFSAWINYFWVRGKVFSILFIPVLHIIFITLLNLKVPIFISWKKNKTVIKSVVIIYLVLKF